MKIKKKKPYNPLTSPMRTEAAILAIARQRAHADTMKQAALVPSDEVVKRAGESLITSLRGTIDPYSQIVQNAGASYADATAGAKADQASVMAQLGAPAGTAAPADTRGGLLGAMAASNLAGMTGSLIGAQQAIPQKITQNAGRRASIMAGEDAAFEAYKQAGYDDALRIGAAQSNAALAGMTLGSTDAARQAATRQGDERIDISKYNAETGRMRLDAAKAREKDPVLQKGLERASAAINAVLRGRGKGTRTTGATYFFELPSIVPGGKAKVVRISARNGNEAQANFVTKMKETGQIPGYIYDAKKPPRSYYSNKMEKTTENYVIAGTRSAALNEAIRILVAVGYDDVHARLWARRLLGSPPPRGGKPNATSSASR